MVFNSIKIKHHVPGIHPQKTVKTCDGQNHVTSVTDPRGNTTSYSYDGDHNLVRATNPLGKSVANTYDSQFRLTDVTDPLGHVTHTDYNAKHHPIKTTVSPASGQTISTQATYSANGLASSTTDGTNVVTYLGYDSRGNPASRKVSSSPAITYVHDLIGRMTSLTDQAGSRTSFSYDKRNLVTSSTDPLGRRVTRTYNDDGTLKTLADRNGRTTTAAYTASGKPSTVTYQSGAQVVYTYDQQDNLTAMRDNLGTSSYAYDAANRLSGSTDPRGFALSYQRDANGNITRITYPGNKTVSYTYDALNRVTAVSIDWLGKAAAYTYDDAGRLTGLTQFNGTAVQYGYDNANRLTGLNHLSASGGSGFASYAFTLDGNGNRTQVNQTAPLAATVTPGTTSYTMNAQKNRLVQAGSTTLTYDGEGQLLTKASERFTFDDAHRLTAITNATASTFRYDGAGNRLEATRNGVVSRYIYDVNGNLLAEADGNNVIQKYYIYGDGLLAMVTSSGTLYCYHHDATGHTIALTDANRAVVNKYAYTPFGVIAGQEEAISQPFKYAGKFGVMAEPDGFYYMRARYYDPSVGRFISEDPIGFEGGDVNLMAYVGNNPVMRVDPSGLWAAGISGEVSTINPFTSGGGGSYGFNLEYTSDSGLHLYTYSTPNNAGSVGFLPGVSLTANVATGNGDWTGPFESGNGSFGPFTGGYFQSPANQPDPGYFGLTLGVALGPPGVGFTTTDYQRTFPDTPCK